LQEKLGELVEVVISIRNWGLGRSAPQKGRKPHGSALGSLEALVESQDRLDFIGVYLSFLLAPKHIQMSIQDLLSLLHLL
jgi:hypothetical protein